jgi:hypothetical protein
MVKNVIKRSTTHTLMALAEASLIALVVVGLIASTAFAAKGDGGKPTSGGTIELRVLDGGDSVPNHGETVTFDVSTTATTRPSVALSCYQDGTWVYAGSVGYFPEYPWDQFFILRNQTWSSGAADCTAKLYYTNSRGRTVTLTTVGFHVGA